MMTDPLDKEVAELSELERVQILSVLHRDEILRTQHQLQMMRLKGDLQLARRKGALKCGVIQSSRSCSRCRAELGRIINRGAFCRACRHRVCKSCREYSSSQTTEWVCTVCFKHMELTAASGDWINDFVHRPNKRRDNRISAAENVRHSIQRSWTFSDASPSPWSALRGSPELRAYSSMPRHVEDCDFIPRTLFTNRLNLTNKNTAIATDNNSANESKNDIVSDKESDKEDKLIEIKINDIAIIDKEIMDKTSDSEPSIIDEHLNAVQTTDNDSSIGSPLIDKRSYSESTSVDQSSIGSPVTDKRFCSSPLVDNTSCSGSPVVEKRIISDSVVEPLTGTVFRKVTLRKRRVDTRNLPPGVTPPRSRRSLRTNQMSRHNFYHEDYLGDYTNPFLEHGRFFVPDGEDYKLVFISSSDSSSREELQSDDNSSTSSGLLQSSQLDECDWDYFESSCSTSSTAIVKPIVKDWSWVNNSGNNNSSSNNNNKNNSGGKENNTEKGDLNNENGAGDGGKGEGGEGERQRQTETEEISVSGSLKEGNGVPPPVRVVVPHRPAETQPPSAQVKFSEASGFKRCGSISCVPVPIPVPVPVPFPILIPIPWQPDLTIRIQHSLAPVWSSFVPQQLITVTSSSLSSNTAPPSDGSSIMTEQADDVNKKEENNELSSTSKDDTPLPSSELQTVDELSNKSVPDVIVGDNNGEQQSSENIVDGVVLKMYKTLDDNGGEIVVKQDKNSVVDNLENYSNESASSTTTSEDENDHEYVGKIKRRAGRRIYSFNRADTDSESSGSESTSTSSNNDDDESSGEFSMESSAASSDECIADGGSGKHFKKIFVVNDSDSDIGELPEYNDEVVDLADGRVTLLKHVKHADNVKLSSILNNAGELNENSQRFIDLKSVLNDVKCGKTGSSEESDINSGELFVANDSSDLEPVVVVGGVQEEAEPTNPVVDDNSSLITNNEGQQEAIIPKTREEEEEIETCVVISGETTGDNVGSSGGDLTVCANSKESGSGSSSVVGLVSNVPSSGGSVRDVERTLHDKTVNNECNVGLSLSSELSLSERDDDKSPEQLVCDNVSIVDNTVVNNKSEEDVVNIKVSDGVISSSNNNHLENRNFIINEFLTNEIDFCNKMNSVNNDSYIYTSTEDDICCDKKAVIDVVSDEELGKSEGTRGSNTSDEFSGTESMELEQQGQIRSSGPVTCVEAATSCAPVAGESCKETAAARYTSLVMITQEHNTTSPVDSSSVSVITTDTTTVVPQQQYDSGEVHVVTGRNTLSAVVCLEDGLPDDDSWVEDLDRDDFGTTTEESSDGDEGSMHDREEELRGYHRAAIDFTLHTIVEESCEESEVETDKNRPTELEKYFFYGLGDGTNGDQRELDTMSETSSIYSEGLESLGGGGNGEQGGEAGVDPAELASSRLEKYFLAFNRRDSDGSVGSDSEGRPSPEQRRKRLVRARGTGRQQSSSLDNLTESEQQDELQVESEGSSTETDSHDEQSNSFEKNDGQFDTVKRTKKKKRSVVTAPPLDLLETQEDETISGSKEDLDSDDGNKTPQPEFLLPADLGSSRNKQQSRDSGFMGSCDDLLKESRDSPSADTPNVNEEEIKEASIKPQEKILPPMSTMSSAPPATGLTRKDSFNNWSSDEETNLMMSKMRAFFKTMVGTQPKVSSPNMRTRSKPPQLVYFESELTRLMKTVPGIRDEQVREIVEYLSSEDTWSDSYDSSDYTSSDLEGGNKKTALQEEISASCRQIISNFETQEDQLTGADSNINKDTAFVYQRLVASFSKIETASSDSSTSHSSPPLIAKVMQHIGSRLVALMHEVSGGEGGSPKASRYHRRLQPKLSTTSTTEDEEDSIEDYSPLPRSKSHDPLIEENRQEASDNERFSWRGSFESALMASDSRTRLASGGEASASALALAAKRRSAGDLLFKSCSREQLDRVRSCGSIGGSVEDKIWGLRHPKRRRSSVPDSGGSNDGDDDSDEDSGRSTTLPRSLQTSCAATNSLPRLPTSPTSASPSIYKAHSVHQFNVKSARYRPPGYSIRSAAAAVAPPRRDPARRRAAQTPSPSNIVSAPPSVASDDASVCSEPVGTPRSTEEDVDRLLTQTRATLGARSDSLASVYSGAGEGRYGSVAVRGEVEFGLQYNYKQGALEIYVKQCRDLAPVDTKRNRSDPYVKVYLLPDKSKSGKRKTKVKKHTLNPVFEETLKFHITLEGLESRTLWLSVWHSDMFGRNDFLGEVTMTLENKVFDDPMPRFYTLQERSEPLEELLSSKGELIVGLKFVPPDSSATTSSSKKRGANKGSLHVLVKEAKNLAAVKSNGTSDPFCKSYLLPDKGRSSKQKTPVSRRSCSPAWNHTFVYHGVSLTDLPERSLELTIWDHDRLASNEFLGGVRLNLGTGKHNGKAVDWMDSSGKETVLWQRMLERPNLWVESCLPLRPSLDVRSSS